MTAPTTGEREPDEISAALNDLEHAVKCEYAFPNVHPAMQRKFDRDMRIVNDARKAYEELRDDLARVTAERDRLQELSEVAGAFHRKHAFGSLSAPSCLACGRAEPFATTHAELPNIGLCASCATAQREAAGLREDAKRIDWLQERFVRIAIDHGDVDVAVFRVPAETFGLLGFNHDLRAMVDCARFPDEAIAQARAGATTFTPTTKAPTDA